MSYACLLAADADRRDGFGGPQVQQTTAESSYTSDSYSARAGQLVCYSYCNIKSCLNIHI